MLATKLLLITDTLSARERAQQSLVKAAAAFPSSTLPAPSYLTVEEALSDSASLGGPTAAWLVLEDDADGDAEFAVTSRLHEKHLPVAVSSASCGHAGQEIEPGVVACPIDSEATLIAAILGALLAGGSVTQSLAQETRMLRAQSTGMAGQFDKIDEELRMALKIQREFLPKTLPSLDGLMFDVLWRPASYVGGDIYDVQRLDEHHIGVFIADAVGHGVPAALMTVYIKQAMVTRQITPGVGAGYRIVPPGEALAGLNRAMIEQDAGVAARCHVVFVLLQDELVIDLLDRRSPGEVRVCIDEAGHERPAFAIDHLICIGKIGADLGTHNLRDPVAGNENRALIARGTCSVENPNVLNQGTHSIHSRRRLVPSDHLSGLNVQERPDNVKYRLLWFP